MKVIVTAAPVIGHLNPLLAIGRILAERGHEVVAYAPSDFRGEVEINGLKFHSYRPDADFSVRARGELGRRSSLLPPGYGALKLDWEQVFVERMDAEYQGLRALLRDFPADVILAESMTFATLPMLTGAHAGRPAIAHVGVTFLQLSREDRAPMFAGLPPATSETEHGAYAATFAQAKAEWFDPIDALINAVLTARGCPPLTMPFYDAAIRLPDLFLQVGVPEFELPTYTLPSSLHFIGATAPAPGRYPIPPWAKDLENGRRRLVLVTQGIAANAHLDHLIGPTFEALAGEKDMLVIATTGGRPVETLGTLPSNARLAPFLPYDWLMPKLDLVVTNAGHGFATQALSLGIPLVQAGTTEDKREVATRIIASGVGIALGTDVPTPLDIRNAVQRVLAYPSYRQNADALSRAFDAHDLRRQIGPLFQKLMDSAWTSAIL